MEDTQPGAEVGHAGIARTRKTQQQQEEKGLYHTILIGVPRSSVLVNRTELRGHARHNSSKRRRDWYYTILIGLLNPN